MLGDIRDGVCSIGIGIERSENAFLCIQEKVEEKTDSFPRKYLERAQNYKEIRSEVPNSLIRNNVFHLIRSQSVAHNVLRNIFGTKKNLI